MRRLSSEIAVRVGIISQQDIVILSDDDDPSWNWLGYSSGKALVTIPRKREIEAAPCRAVGQTEAVPPRKTSGLTSPARLHAPQVEVVFAGDERQTRGDGFKLAAGLDLVGAKAVYEDVAHRRHKTGAAGQEDAVDLVGV